MSLADAAPGLTVAAALPVHSAVTGAGQVMVGAVVSCTRTLLVHALVLPDWSWAEYVSVVVPSGEEAGPLGPVTVVAVQTSLADAAAGVTAAAALPVHPAASGRGVAAGGA